MMNKILSIFSFILIVSFEVGLSDSCIVDKDSRDISRNIFTYPETIQSENFVVHFTTSTVESQLVDECRLLFRFLEGDVPR